MATLEDVRTAKAHAHAVFSKIADVGGVGITQTGAGTDYALKVNLGSQPQGPLPQTVDGIPVLVEIVGTIEKQ